MAYRRDVRGQFGDLMETLLKAHLQQRSLQDENDLIMQRQAAESGLVGQRQREAADQAAENQLWEKALGDPTQRIFAALQKSGRARIGPRDISSFFPTADDAEQAVSGTIAKAPDLGRVPTVSDIEAEYYGAPGAPTRPAVPPGVVDSSQSSPALTRMFAQAEAKRQAFKNATTPTLVTQMTDGPNAHEEQIPVNLATAPGPFPKTLPPLLEGRRLSLIDLGKIQPDLTAAKIAEANQTTAGESKAKAAAGGALAREEAKARFPFEQQLAQTRADLTNENRPISQQGKMSLEAILNMQALGPKILERMRQTFPGIENHLKDFGGIEATAEAKLNKAKYVVGMYRPDEDIPQMTQLFKVIGVRPYMMGRMNEKIYRDATTHLGDFGFSPGADYARIQTILGLVPDIKNSIEEVETPGFLRRERTRANGPGRQLLGGR